MADLTTPFRPSDIPTGLVAYWKFNNAATDSSANGYTLTGTNTPAYAVDDYWKSGEYSCDLVASTPTYFKINDNDTLDLVDAFTIAGWIKADDITTTTIIDKGSGTTGYAVKIDASSKIVLNLNNGARATSATAIVADKWFHFVAVYNQTNAQIYLNGNLDINSAYSTDCQATSTDLYVGIEDDGSTSPYDGHIKDLAIWNVALTPLQIKSLALGVDIANYTYRPSRVSTQPTHWWKLNEISGDRLDSVSTNPLTLTDNNTVLSTGGYFEGTAATTVAGSSESLSSADDADFDTSGGIWTIATWFKTSTLAATQVLWAHGTDNANWHHLELSTAGTLSYIVQAANVDVVTVVSAAAIITTNTWYHIAVRENGDTYSIIVDGVDQTATGGTDTSRSANYTGTFYIGADALNAVYSTGTFTDFAMWKTYAVTNAELDSLACGLPIQQTGLVSYWKLDEASGTRVDSIGNNDLTDNNTVTSGTGQSGNAASFASANSEYLSITDAAQVGLETDEFTILAWNKPDTPSGTRAVVAKVTGAVGDSAGGYFIYNDGANNILAYVDSLDLVDAVNPTSGVWYHNTLLSNAAQISLYTNAVEMNTKTKAASITNAKHFNIGAYNDGASGHYNGLIEDVLYAKRYFLPEEIKTVYNKGLNGKEATSSEAYPIVYGGVSAVDSYFMMF